MLATRSRSSFTRGHPGARRLAGLFAGAALAACEVRPAPEPGGEAAAPGAAPAEAAAPFVVFTSPSLVVDRLEAPVPAPVTVGSSPSPLTLRSSAPEVVSVLPDGALVGHRAGKATIRAVDGRAVLEVEVRPVAAIAVVPGRVAMAAGGGARLGLVAALGGEEIPAAAAEWSSDAPEVALVREGRVEALAPGQARITASYGGRSATAAVEVAGGPEAAIRLRPEAPRLSVGEQVAFELLGPEGPVRAEMVSRTPGVLVQLGPSLFSARGPGKGVVCGRALGREACTEVRVGR